MADSRERVLAGIFSRRIGHHILVFVEAVCLARVGTSPQVGNLLRSINLSVETEVSFFEFVGNRPEYSR